MNQREALTGIALLLGGMVFLAGPAAADTIDPYRGIANSTVQGFIDLNATVDDPQNDLNTSANETKFMKSGSLVTTSTFNTTFDTVEINDGTFNITFNTYNESDSTNPNGTALVRNVTVNNAPTVTSIQPNENTNISGTIDIKGAASDPNGDPISRSYRWYRDGSPVTQSSQFNDTFDTSSLNETNYTLRFTATDTTGKSDFEDVKNISIEIPLTVDDGNTSTQTSYPDPIAFIGDLLSITGGGNSTHTYNLTNSTGLVDEITGLTGLDSSGTSPDRHEVQDENSTKNATIDLFSPVNDVVGRIDSRNNVNVDVLHWINGSNASGTAKFNVSQNQWPSASGSETAFRMNKSQDEYWLRLQTDAKTIVKGSRGVSTFLSSGVDAPRVQDFVTGEGANITGQVTLNSSGNPVSDLKLRLRRKDSKYAQKRIPYFTGPPEKYTFTDGSGNYKFSGLQSGSSTRYLIDVVNKSHTKKNHRSPFDDQGVKLDSLQKTFDFDVTNNTGNVSIELIGKDEEDLRFGFLLQGNSSGYLEPGVSPGETVKLGVENKTYDIIAARFNVSNSSEPQIVTETEKVTVQEGGEEGPIELGFPALVSLNGTIDDLNSNGVEGASVIVKNESEKTFYTGRTDGNGYYDIQVENDTNYTMKVRPPFDSSLKTDSSNITITGDSTEDRTLSEGPFINGTVTDGSGNPVSDADISAWNGSKNSYGRAKTDSSGEYKVGGLEKNINYSLFVSPPDDSSLPNQEVNLNLSGDNVTKDISLTVQKNDLDVNITDSSGSSLNATVFVRSDDTGVRNKKDISGNGTFSNLEQGFYRIKVEPDNSSYRDDRDSLFLSSNSSIDFELSEFKGVSGKVKNSGNGVSDVYIYAYNYSKRSFGTDQTDSSGDYQLDLSEVDHKVEIYPSSDSSYRSNSTTISKSTIGGTRNFNISSGSSLEGDVEDNKNNSLSGFISVYNISEQSYGFKEFSGGSYKVKGLDSSISYKAYISVDSSDFNSKTFSVGTSNFTNGRNFTFGKNKGPKLKVEVTNTNDVPLTNATVQADGEQKLTDSNGEALFGKRSDKTENVTIGVYKENHNSSSKTVKVKREKSTGFNNNKETIDIWNESFTIENIQGQLKDYDVNVTENGNDVSSATVVARSNKSSSFSSSTAITDGNGKGTLEDINPGYYLVTVVDGDDINRDVIDFENSVNNTFQLKTSGYNVGVEGTE